MDERVRKYRRLSRRVLFVAAIAVGNTAAFGDESSGNSVRARLASGFGAGTNQGIVQRATTRRAAQKASRSERSTSQREPSKISVRVAESDPFKDQKIPVAQEPKRQLADLIRISKTDRSLTTNRSVRVAPLVTVQSGNDSIRVAVAPTVRRIQLGSYDPERSESANAGSVIRLAQPVDPILLPRPKARVIVVPPLSNGTSAENGSVRRLDLPQLPKGEVQDIPEVPQAATPESLNVIPPFLPLPQSDTSTLMQAQDIPALTGLIEARAVSTQSNTTDVIRQLEGLATERSRRLADLNGFNLLPIDRIGQE